MLSARKQLWEDGELDRADRFAIEHDFHAVFSWGPTCGVGDVEIGDAVIRYLDDLRRRIDHAAVLISPAQLQRDIARMTFGRDCGVDGIARLETPGRDSDAQVGADRAAQIDFGDRDCRRRGHWHLRRGGLRGNCGRICRGDCSGFVLAAGR